MGDQCHLIRDQCRLICDHFLNKTSNSHVFFLEQLNLQAELRFGLAFKGMRVDKFAGTVRSQNAVMGQELQWLDFVGRGWSRPIKEKGGMSVLEFCAQITYGML